MCSSSSLSVILTPLRLFARLSSHLILLILNNCPSNCASAAQGRSGANVSQALTLPRCDWPQGGDECIRMIVPGGVEQLRRRALSWKRLTETSVWEALVNVCSYDQRALTVKGVVAPRRRRYTCFSPCILVLSLFCSIAAHRWHFETDAFKLWIFISK